MNITRFIVITWSVVAISAIAAFAAWLAWLPSLILVSSFVGLLTSLSMVVGCWAWERGLID